MNDSLISSWIKRGRMRSLLLGAVIKSGISCGFGGQAEGRKCRRSGSYQSTSLEAQNQRFRRFVTLYAITGYGDDDPLQEKSSGFSRGAGSAILIEQPARSRFSSASLDQQ